MGRASAANGKPKSVMSRTSPTSTTTWFLTSMNTDGASPFTSPRAFPVRASRHRSRRHEHYLALMLGLRPGMRVADLGCGIGGPLLEIARFCGARIVGINSNAYQLERARRLAEEAHMTHLAEFLHCDFSNVDAPEESFDAVYGIEATCCAPDKLSAYGEAFRLLKPGAYFANYEYCLTERFDALDPKHLEIKAGIELGGGLLDIDDKQTVDNALRTVGFEVLETRDLAIQTGPSIPWYEPLAGSGISVAAFRSFAGRPLGHTELAEDTRGAPHCAERIGSAYRRC